MNSASTSISDCECEKGYYNQRSAANNTVVCGLCPVGSACLDVGITLDTLPLLPGYYRSSDRSNDLRRCPDFGAGSGCVGGVADGHGPCKQWLTGPYCRLCNVTDVSRYYNIEESACLPCEANTMVIPLVICGAIIAGIAVSLCCRRFRKRCNVPSLVRLSRKLRRLLSHLSLRAKMKQLLGFYQIATRVSDVYETPMPEVSPRPPQPYGSKPKPNPNPNKLDLARRWRGCSPSLTYSISTLAALGSHYSASALEPTSNSSPQRCSPPSWSPESSCWSSSYAPATATAQRASVQGC